MTRRQQGTSSATTSDVRDQAFTFSGGNGSRLVGGLSALVALFAWLTAFTVIVVTKQFETWHIVIMAVALSLSVPFVIGTTRNHWQGLHGCLDDPVQGLLGKATARAGYTLQTDSDLRHLRAEMAHTLSRQAGVSFAAVLAAPEFLADSGHELGQDSNRTVFWRRSDTRPVWKELSRNANAFFDQVKLQPEQLYFTGERGVLTEYGLQADILGDCDSWLMTPMSISEQVPLLVLLGTQRRVVSLDQLKAILTGLQAQIAPALVVHRYLTLARNQVILAKSDNETLSRLNEMQGDFVAVASHELKTPLTSIGAYTEVLLQNIDNSAFAHREEFLGIIKEETERLLRMVNRILDFSRLEFGQRLLKKEVVSLEPLIRDTAKTLEPQIQRKSQQLVIACMEDLPRVDADTDLIRQVLINLLSNAIKYSPEGGRISVRACEDAATVRVDVLDTGPGIPADELRSIFRQFYRVRTSDTTEEGVGLGLTIVKNIVDMHNGHIDVKSKEGAGATFSFHLPKEYHFHPAPVAVLGDLPSQIHFKEIMRLCLRMVAELMESRTVALILMDDQERELLIQSGLGLSRERVESYRVPKNQGLVGEVMLTGEPKLGRTDEDDGPLTEVVPPPGDSLDQAIAPIVIGSQVIGVVAVTDKVNASAFDADDLNLFATLCERISAAMAGALKHSGDANRLAKIVEALQALVKMKRSSIPTVNPLALRLLARTAGLLGFSPAEVKRLQYLVALHDAGMVRVDEDIVHKTGGLTADEREEVDSHVEKGAGLMAPLLLSPEMEEIILTHHEWMDGSGYPAGRQGGEIPLGSRILAVIDAFFAMIQNRPYRTKMPPAEVIAEIQTHTGTQFDPSVVDSFIRVLHEEGIITSDAYNEAGIQTQTWLSPDEGEQTWQPLES